MMLSLVVFAILLSSTLARSTIHKNAPKKHISSTCEGTGRFQAVRCLAEVQLSKLDHSKLDPQVSIKALMLLFYASVCIRHIIKSLKNYFFEKEYHIYSSEVWCLLFQYTIELLESKVYPSTFIYSAAIINFPKTNIQKLISGFSAQ